MKAGTIDLQALFQGTTSYRIPLFQRPYVWDRDRNWEPIWGDISAMAKRIIKGLEPEAHFLGAIVVDQLPTPLGRVNRREIIDGQQRLTTLQIFFAAARDLSRARELGHHAQYFGTLLENDPIFVKEDSEQFKVWPTNRDRLSFSQVMNAGSPAQLRKSFGVGNSTQDLGHKIPNAYVYFWDRLAEHLDDNEDTELVDFDAQTRMESIWLTVQRKLLLVSIDLEKGDDAQIIFETLNARGTPLLPADLVKNYLFHRAEIAKCDSEALYERYWHDFDERFWRSEVVQGRWKRPRIDLFLQHYLTLTTLDEVPVTQVFGVFRKHVELDATGHSTAAAVESLLALIRKYADCFASFYNPKPGTREAIFFERMAIMQTATIYPFLLEAFKQLGEQDRDADRVRLLETLESYLVRRMVCGLTTKNYNKLFLDLVTYCSDAGDFGPQNTRDFLAAQDAESARWPSDEEFGASWSTNPIYRQITRPRLRMLLLALNDTMAHAKSEVVEQGGKLTVEHLLPQTWENTWPLEARDDEDPVVRLERIDRRNQLLQTIGNLTLLTNSLNPAVSNSPWERKRPEILKYSQLNLTRELHDAAHWDEDAIRKRSEDLFRHAVSIWPR
jgi:hypothetical protein